MLGAGTVPCAWCAVGRAAWVHPATGESVCSARCAVAGGPPGAVASGPPGARAAAAALCGLPTAAGMHLVRPALSTQPRPGTAAATFPGAVATASVQDLLPVGDDRRPNPYAAGGYSEIYMLPSVQKSEPPRVGSVTIRPSVRAPMHEGYSAMQELRHLLGAFAAEVTVAVAMGEAGVAPRVLRTRLMLWPRVPSETEHSNDVALWPREAMLGCGVVMDAAHASLADLLAHGRWLREQASAKKDALARVTLRAAEEVLTALLRMHRAGFSHGDVKPDNTVVWLRDGPAGPPAPIFPGKNGVDRAERLATRMYDANSDGREGWLERAGLIDFGFSARAPPTPAPPPPAGSGAPPVAGVHVVATLGARAAAAVAEGTDEELMWLLTVSAPTEGYHRSRVVTDFTEATISAQPPYPLDDGRMSSVRAAAVVRGAVDAHLAALAADNVRIRRVVEHNMRSATTLIGRNRMPEAWEVRCSLDRDALPEAALSDPAAVGKRADILLARYAVVGPCLALLALDEREAAYDKLAAHALFHPPVAPTRAAEVPPADAPARPPRAAALPRRTREGAPSPPSPPSPPSRGATM